MEIDSDLSNLEEHNYWERRTVSISVEDLRRALQNAVVTGVKEVIKDPETKAALGEALYKSLVAHGSKDAKIWVGGKVIAGLATLLLAAAITFYVRYGPK